MRSERHPWPVASMHRMLASRARERIFRLQPPLTRDVLVQRDLPVPMPDGVILLADRYVAQAATGPPTVLIRSPYGRTGGYALLCGRPLAERGFQVIIQSVRGTAGSGGRFIPQANERDDGLATVRWIRSQPWFGGQLATAGISYLGYTQWAIADEAELDAICLQATMPSFDEPTYDGGSFSLGNSLPWTRMVSRSQSRFGQLRDQFPAFTSRELRAGLDRLPLRDGDLVTLGRHVDFYQDWLVHHPADEYWAPQSHTPRVGSVTTPISMRTGWYDIFLPWMLRDYATLAAAGNPPRLTIGPWGHLSPGLLRGIPRETVDFLSEQLLDAPPRLGAPVRYHVTGAAEWRDADSWPPPGVRDQEWMLRAAGELVGAAVAVATGTIPGPAMKPPLGRASAFRYDPADPTPSIGGPVLAPGRSSVDNRQLEQRADVLVFTSLPLVVELDVIGTPRARLTVSADNRHHDLFVRLCDVHPDGTSLNISDRLIRLDDLEPGPDGTRTAELELWPMAHRFAAGHRVRVQVSGGAHPRYARNLGTGEPLATATATRPTTISVHHDPEHPSALTLPVAHTY